MKLSYMLNFMSLLSSVLGLQKNKSGNKNYFRRQWCGNIMDSLVLIAIETVIKMSSCESTSTKTAS